MDLSRKIAMVCRDYRRMYGNLKQSEVAAEAGISLRYYVSLEQGERNPGLDVIEKIAKVYNLKLSDFCLQIERC